MSRMQIALTIITLLLAGVSPLHAQLVETPPTADDRKAALELEKLEVEIQNLRADSGKGDWSGWLTAVGLLVSAAIGSAGVAHNLVQKRKLEQDLKINKTKHLLEVFKELGSQDPKIRMGAVAILARWLRELDYELRETGNASDEPREERRRLRTITSVLVSVTKFEDTEEIQKYIADNIAKSLGAIIPEDKPTLDPDSTSPLKHDSFDLQGGRFTNAWWSRLDARHVDFYGATLRRASLRGAFLHHATLSKADLRDAVFVDADLIGALLKNSDLREAKLSGADLTNANLTGAKLCGATLCSDGSRQGRITRLDGATLNRTCFDGADLTGVDFSRANVDKSVSFRGAKTKDAVLPPGFDDWN